MRGTQARRRIGAGGAGATRALGGALLAAWLVACQPAPVSVPPRPTAPVDPLARAAALLDREDFDGASRSLSRYVEACDPDMRETRHRATLLLATSELDVANPSGSPDRAAALALRLVGDPEVSDERAAVARTLFRLALDRGASDPMDPAAVGEHGTASAEPDPEREPGVETELEPGAAEPVEVPTAVCAMDRTTRAQATGGRPARIALSPPPGPTTAERLAALQDSLSVREDSLRQLRTSVGDMRARVLELETELERIRKLLKGPPRR